MGRSRRIQLSRGDSTVPARHRGVLDDEKTPVALPDDVWLIVFSDFSLQEHWPLQNGERLANTYVLK